VRDITGSRFKNPSDLAFNATPATGTSLTVITRRMTPDQFAEYQ